MGTSGEWLPTQKGIRVNSEEYPQLLKVLLDTMTTDEYQDLESLGYYVDEMANIGLYEDKEDEEEGGMIKVTIRDMPLEEYASVRL